MQHALKNGIKGLVAAGLSIFLALTAGEVLADGKGESHGHGHGKNRNLGHHSASDGVKAEIKANRQIFYSGDPLLISLKFPRGADLVTSGEVDAYLLMFKPDADTIVLPVSNIASEKNQKLFNIMGVDTEKLPEGVYQLAVVLTVPDGDPLNVEDWYNGLLGMVAMRGLTVSGEPLDVDADHDGEVDCDSDDDGYVDEGSVCEDDLSDDDSTDGDSTDDDSTDDGSTDGSTTDGSTTDGGNTDGDTTGDDTTDGDTTDGDTTGGDTTDGDTTDGGDTTGGDTSGDGTQTE